MSCTVYVSYHFESYSSSNLYSKIKQDLVVSDGGRDLGVCEWSMEDAQLGLHLDQGLKNFSDFQEAFSPWPLRTWLLDKKWDLPVPGSWLEMQKLGLHENLYFNKICRGLSRIACEELFQTASNFLEYVKYGSVISSRPIQGLYSQETEEFSIYSFAF